MFAADKEKELKILVKKLKIEKTDLELLNEALTHPSFNFEQNLENAPDYERLEFLGDSVVRLVISEYLYDKYPTYDEGILTKIRSYLVSDEFFAMICKRLEIQKFINIGKHEEKDKGREKSSILACATEAVFGAVFKSLGFDKTKKFIFDIYNSIQIDIDYILHMHNAKELLQQYTQAKNKDLPEYKIIKEFGLAHDKTYEVSVNYENKILGTGVGKTKKDAEKEAAYNAIKELKII